MTTRKPRVAPQTDQQSLADLIVRAEVAESPWRLPHASEHRLADLALLMLRPGGFSRFWWEIAGFASVLTDIADVDDPSPEMLAQVRSIAAGIQALLTAVDPMEATDDDAARCLVARREKAVA